MKDGATKDESHVTKVVDLLQNAKVVFAMIVTVGGLELYSLLAKENALLGLACFGLQLILFITLVVMRFRMKRIIKKYNEETQAEEKDDN